MAADHTEAVNALLVQTMEAHGRYEESELNGVYDQEWARWYAAYAVEHGIGSLIGHDVTADQLRQFLSGSNDEKLSQLSALLAGNALGEEGIERLRQILRGAKASGGTLALGEESRADPQAPRGVKRGFQAVCSAAQARTARRTDWPSPGWMF